MRILRLSATAIVLSTLAFAAEAEPVFTSGFENDVTRADVVWDARTRLIEGDAMDALESADPEAGSFVFLNAGLSDAGITLAIDDVLLVSGLSLGTITGLSDDGTRTTVTTGPATLADAIESGRLFVQLDIGYDELATAKVSIPKGTCSPSLEGTTVTFTCTFNDYTVTMKLTGGHDQTVVQYGVLKGDAEGTHASFTGTGTFSQVTQVADIAYDGGELDSVDYRQDGLQMDFNIALAAAAAGSSTIREDIPFPIFTIPFTVGPIPMSVTIGAGFVAQLTVPAEASASATAQANYRYRSDSGLTFEGGTAGASAQLSGVAFSDGAFDAASTFVPVDAQFGLAVPRIALNVFTSEVAYILSGITIGSNIQFGPICKSGYSRVLIQGGYGLTILGIPLVDQTNQILAEDQIRVPEGGCP